MKIGKILFTTLLAVPMLIASPTQAELLVGNMSKLSTAFQDARLGPVFPDNIGIAQGFTTDSSTWTVSDIQVYLGDSQGSLSMTAALYQANTAGDFQLQPAFLVGNFTVPLVGAPRELLTFSPSSPLTLFPNTTYYFLLMNTSGSVAWDYVASMEEDGRGTFPDLKTYFYTDSATPWRYGEGNPGLFQVNGTAVVPEPSTAAIMFSGAGILLVRLFRRRS